MYRLMVEKNSKRSKGVNGKEIEIDGVDEWPYLIGNLQINDQNGEGNEEDGWHNEEKGG